jgi:hypothetical protein
MTRVSTKKMAADESASAAFEALLRDKGVQPEMTWLDVVPLIANDPRYLSLPTVELRKQAFSDFAASVERERRHAKVRERLRVRVRRRFAKPRAAP